MFQIEHIHGNSFQKLFLDNKSDTQVFNFSILSVPDEDYSRNGSCALSLISTFFNAMYHDTVQK